MLQKLGLVDLIAAIQNKVEDKTKLRCYDAVPLNAPSPFYFAEVIGTRPADTKTMWCEVFTVWIHAIAEPSSGNTRVYDLIQQLEESLTEEIELPEQFELLLQTGQGIQVIKMDETNEKHAVLAYEFKVCYGFRCK